MSASENGHTPGPWKVDDHSSRLEIVGRPNWKCRRLGVEGEWRVAVVDVLSEDQDGAEFETEANARLIAAAPTMLEALKQALLYIERDEVAHGRPFAAGNVVRAAISKAEGGAA